MNQTDFRMREDAPIDFFDLIKRFLIEWRAVVIFALLLGGVAFAVYNRREARKTAQKAEQTAEQTESAAQSTEASLRAGLTEDELNAVLLAVQQENSINVRTKYLTDAAWLQSDDDQYELVYFLIRLQGDWVKPTALKRYYGGFIYSSDYLKELAALSDGKINEADASELITTDMMITGADEEPGEAQTIALAVLIPEGISSEDVIETTEKAFFKYKETVDEQVGEHTLRFDQEDIRNRYDQSPVGRRRDVLYEIYNLKAQMKATVDTFSSKQRMLFEKMTGSITEEELTTVSTSTTKGYGKGVFLAGAVLAVFLYFCLMILRSLIRSRIHTKKELTGVPYLGEVRSYHARNIADAFIRSKFVYRLFYGKYSEKKQVLEMSELAAGKQQNDQLTLLEIGGPNEVMKEMSAELTKTVSGIGIQTKEVISEQNKKMSPSAIGTDQAMILIVGAGTARYESVKEIVSVCSLADNRILGYILCGV